MYCRKCGKPIPEDGEFCMMCGTPAFVEPCQLEKQPNQKKTKEKEARKKSTSSRLKTLIIILMSVIVVALIALVLLLILDVFPTGSMSVPKEENLIYYDIRSENGLLKFSAVIEGMHYTDITYEYDDDKYDEVTPKDFMEDAIDLTLIIKDDEGEKVCTEVIESFMVIETNVDDSVRFKDYKKAKTLYIHDPRDNIEIDDILEIESLSELYLDGFCDNTNIEDLSELKTLKTLSLKSMDIKELPDLSNFESLQKLTLNSLPLKDLEGVENAQSLLMLTLFSLPNLESIDDTKDLHGLKVIFTGNLPNISSDDIRNVANKLPKETIVYLNVIPKDITAFYTPELKTANITIGFVNSGSYEYFSYFEEAFKALAELESIEVITRNSCYEEKKELGNVRELIDLGVDALAVVPVYSEKPERIVELANEAGVPIFFISDYPAIDDEINTIHGKIKNSHVMSSYLLGKWVAKNYPGVKCVNLPKNLWDSDSFSLIVGFNEGLSEKGMKPATVLSHTFEDLEMATSVKVAQKAIEDIIKNYNFDLIFVYNESSFEAVENILKSRGKEDTVIVSTYGMEKYWSNIMDGSLAATTQNPPTLLADLCLQQIIACFNGNEYDQFLEIFQTEVLTKDNYDNTIPWDVQNYIIGRLSGDFEYELSYYERLESSSRDLIIKLYKLTIEYMKEH